MSVHESRDDLLGTALLVRARNAIGCEFGLQLREEPEHPALSLLAATFVTLHRDGMLRGCIGRLEAERPLDEDVRANAIAAAFEDRRFPPLRSEEFDALHIEVSVLGAPQRVAARSEEAVAQALRLDEDGVILAWHGRRATFLPQVWKTIRDPVRFLQALKLKAGMQTDFWAPDVEVSRYRVIEYEECKDA